MSDLNIVYMLVTMHNCDQYKQHLHLSNQPCDSFRYLIDGHIQYIAQWGFCIK